MTAIFVRELQSQRNGLTAHVLVAFILLFGGIYTMAYNLSGYIQFEYVVYSMSIIFLMAVPLLTMRAIAGERHQKTDQLLYSLPLSMTKIVLGKYFAMVVVLAIPLGIMALYPILMNAAATSGEIPLKAACGALIGFFFLGLALTSIGMFISSLTENVGVAAGLCFMVMLVLYFLASLTEFVTESAFVSWLVFAVLLALLMVLVWRLTKNGGFALGAGILSEGILLAAFLIWKDAFSGLLVTVLGKLSLFDRFDSFVYDIFDVTSIVYYLTVAGVFLFLTVQSMERRRWSE